MVAGVTVYLETKVSFSLSERLSSGIESIKAINSDFGAISVSPGSYSLVPTFSFATIACLILSLI